MGGLVGTDYKYSTIIQQKDVSYGSATALSKRVYNNIKAGVKYISADYAFEGDDYRKFVNNTFTHSFIQSYIYKINNYYTFNMKYIEDNVNNLVSASAVYGLAIGLTDSEYITTIGFGKDASDTDKTSYDNKFVVDLANRTSSSTETRTEYELEYIDALYTLKPISNIVSTKLDFAVTIPSNENKALIGYIIAYEKASYEFWSTTLGYTDNYVVISTNALTES